MLNTTEILQTLRMIDRGKAGRAHHYHGHFPVLLRFATTPGASADRVYDRITRKAERLVKVGEDIEARIRRAHRQ